VRALCFLARRFEWAPHEKTLADAQESPPSDRVDDALVAFLHVEATDAERGAFKKTLKHLKWLAGKREMKTVVLHSFTHLGGTNAEPDAALAFLRELAERLSNAGYDVKITPFGWFCRWTLEVYGESLAKVYKEF
jgi:hypothetical protein